MPLPQEADREPMSGIRWMTALFGAALSESLLELVVRAAVHETTAPRTTIGMP